MSRQLKRKFITGADLQGAIRLILAANNDTLLLDPTEILTSDDTAAYDQRFLFIHVGADGQSPAQKYLRSIGGRKATDQWVSGDLIARHALWLRDNRTSAANSRFLVEGEASAMQRALGTANRQAGEICDWLVSYLEQPKRATQTGGKIFVGNGHYFVSTPAVCDSWQSYMRNGEPMPSKTALGTKLRTLSTTSKRRSISGYKHIFHDINVDALMEWSEKVGVGDIEAMRAKVAQTDSSWRIEDENAHS